MSRPINLNAMESDCAILNSLVNIPRAQEFINIIPHSKRFAVCYSGIMCDTATAAGDNYEKRDKWSFRVPKIGSDAIKKRVINYRGHNH